MTRIVAGSARGRRLQVPAGGTRPTSERAREALFNSLRTHLELGGLAVLDLYAGSGAVGLEALSRGAGRVTLVEQDTAAARTLRRNVATVGLPGAQVVQAPVATALARAPQRPYDLVFADPPYELADDDLAGVLDRLTGGGWLSDAALLVVERAARGGALRWPDGVAPVMNRRYGEAMLWYGRPR